MIHAWDVLVFTSLLSSEACREISVLTLEYIGLRSEEVSNIRGQASGSYYICCNG